MSETKFICLLFDKIERFDDLLLLQIKLNYKKNGAR